ncbi:hypothetical protein [Mycobacterium sp. B14F4]
MRERVSLPEIAAARRLTGRAIAVNLLLPFVRPGAWRQQPRRTSS